MAPFTPGAHLGITVPNGEMRKYSLCNDPDEADRYVIAVKKELGGRGGSVSLIDETQTGDEIAITPPRNDFALKPGPSSYILIAGGIGITPIRAMIKHLMATRAKPFKLYYFTRCPEMMAFRDEFMAPEFRGKVVIHHDGGDPDKAYDLWPVLEEPKGAHLYCCGPRGLMEAVRDMTGHWSSAAVHFEDFGAAKARLKTTRPSRSCWRRAASASRYRSTNRSWKCCGKPARSCRPLARVALAGPAGRGSSPASQTIATLRWPNTNGRATS